MNNLHPCPAMPTLFFFPPSYLKKLTIKTNTVLVTPYHTVMYALMHTHTHTHWHRHTRHTQKVAHDIEIWNHVFVSAVDNPNSRLRVPYEFDPFDEKCFKKTTQCSKLDYTSGNVFCCRCAILALSLTKNERPLKVERSRIFAWNTTWTRTSSSCSFSLFQKAFHAVLQKEALW